MVLLSRGIPDETHTLLQLFFMSIPIAIWDEI